MEIPGYEIIGELAVDRDARRYLARRTEDGASVLITVVGVPEGDEGNALNHLASDVKLMMAQPHHGIVRVLDGRWVGDEFALVTPRPAHPSLEELLVRRDEEFPFERIAAILRDINAALHWARERGVVHRAIRLENVFVEPGSDRTIVAFNVRPIGLTDTPSVAEDDRTIAGLARAMFTRGRRPEQETPLAELRPGLPASLVAQTEALLGGADESASRPDVTSYIASIAMADALKEGEIHLEKNRHLIEEQRREHAAQLEKERREHAEALARERHEHAEALAREKAAHQKEREAHQRDLEAYARDKEVLRVEREAYERERELLRRERADYDKEMSAILAQKARQRTREGVELVARGWRRRPMWITRMTRSWKTTAPIIASAVLVLLAAIALTRRESDPATASAIVADSAAGLVTPTPPTAAPVVPPSVTDSVSRDGAPADSLGVPRGFVASVMARAESLWARRPLRSQTAAGAARPRPAPERQLDTIFTTPQLPPPDTIRRDTIVRRDSVAVPIDTSAPRPQPDTLSRRW